MLSLTPAAFAIVEAATKQKSSPASFLFPLVLILGVVLLFRSQKKRQQALAAAAEETTRSIEPGARILTASGQYATVISIEDGTARLEIAPGVVTEYVVGAIARVVTPIEEEEALPTVTDTGGLDG